MILQTDSSSKGLAVCLLGDEKTVYFASKALREAQKGYVARELKSLVVAWAMEKFCHFLYDNHLILEMDIIEKFKSGNPTVTTNSHQNFPIPLHSA